MVEKALRSPWTWLAAGLAGAVALLLASQLAPGRPRPAVSADVGLPTDAGTPVPVAMPSQWAADLIGERIGQPVEYREVTYRTRRRVPVTCGELKATGDTWFNAGQRFIVIAGELHVLEHFDALNFGRTDRLWKRYCVDTDATEAAGK